MKIIYQEGIKFDLICGTSFGGFVGAALATGISPRDLEKEALRMAQTREFIKLIDPNPLRRGLFEGNRVKAYLENLIGKNHSFESLLFPLKVIAVDLITGTEVVLQSGPLLPAIYATIAIPGIFQPVELGHQLLVDGGVLNNLPVDHARNAGADVMIAIDVQPVVGFENPWDYSRNPNRLIPDSLVSMYRAENIRSNHQTSTHLKNYPPDLLIKPSIPDEIDSLFGFKYAAELIKIGEKAAWEAIPRIKSLGL
jgi:NTE family protein